MKTNKEQSTLDNLISVALEIGREQAEKLKQMKTALEQGDEVEALALARQLCGIEEQPNLQRRMVKQ